MFCKNCGKELEQNATFCSSCGYQIAVNSKTVTPKDENVTKKLMTIGLTFLSFAVQVGVYYLMQKFEFLGKFFGNFLPLICSLLLQILFIVILLVPRKFRSEVLGKIFTGISVALFVGSVFVYLFENMILGFWLSLFAFEFSIAAFLFFKRKIKETKQYNIPTLVLCAILVILSVIIPTKNICPKYKELDRYVAAQTHIWNDGIIEANNILQQRIYYSNSPDYQLYIKPILGSGSLSSKYESYNSDYLLPDRWQLKAVYLNDLKLSAPENFSSYFELDDDFGRTELYLQIAVNPRGSGYYKIPEIYQSYIGYRINYESYHGEYSDYLTKVLQVNTNLTQQEAEIFAESIGFGSYYHITDIQDSNLLFEGERHGTKLPVTAILDYKSESGELFLGFVSDKTGDAIIFQFSDKMPQDFIE